MASRKDVQDIMGLAAGEVLPKPAPIKKAKSAMNHKRPSKNLTDLFIAMLTIAQLA